MTPYILEPKVARPTIGPARKKVGLWHLSDPKENDENEPLNRSKVSSLGPGAADHLCSGPQPLSA